MRFSYPAIVKKETENHYTGFFPDLVDCTFEGNTLNLALLDAIRAGSDWIRLELEEDGELPPLSDPEDLPLGPDESAHWITMIIRLIDGWDE